MALCRFETGNSGKLLNHFESVHDPAGGREIIQSAEGVAIKLRVVVHADKFRSFHDYFCFDELFQQIEE